MVLAPFFKIADMKYTFFFLSSLFIPGFLQATPQDLRHFDDFIHHVRQEAASGVPERIADCFAAQIETEYGCTPEDLGEALGADALRFGWSQVGQDIARFADGFVLIDPDGTMANLHARAAGHPHYLDILGDRVKFRREAGMDGSVMALLDVGTLPGAIDHSKWTVTRDGVQWTPVVAQVPEMGQVHGYICADYVRQADSQGNVKLKARFDGQRWALVGYQRTRSDRPVNVAETKP